MKRIFIWITGLLLLSCSILLIIEGSQKNSMVISHAEFPDQIQVSTGEKYRISAYDLSVNMPGTLLMGSVTHVNAVVTPTITTENFGLPAITDQYDVSLESRLDLANGQIEPQGLIHSSLRASQPTVFTWNLRTDQKTSLKGTLWIYLALSTKGTSSNSEEQALFAIPVDIEVKTIIGLSADLAIVIGIFGSLAAIALIILAILFLRPGKKSRKPK